MSWSAPIAHQKAAVELLLGPVDIVVDQSLRHQEAGAEHQRRLHDEERHGGPRHVDQGMDDAAGVPVSALVAELVRGLERVVADEVLDLQYDHHHQQPGKRVGQFSAPLMTPHSDYGPAPLAGL